MCMRIGVMAVGLGLAGCSFAFVRAPARLSEPPTDPAAVKCNDSGLFPTLDALGGAAAISVAGGGVILEKGSEDGEPENFTAYYAGPLLAVAIVYWAAATFGTNRI